MTDESGESRARGGFHSSFLGRGIVMFECVGTAFSNHLLFIVMIVWKGVGEREA